MLPLTEADKVMCPHGGTVTLKASNTDWQCDNVPILAITDLTGASISGCQYKLPNGTPKPCTVVVSGASTAATKAHRHNIPVSLVEKISTCMTDNGFPVQLSGSPFASGKWNII